MFKRFFFSCAAALLFCATPARATEDERWEFAWNATIHIVHHEIGHALVDKFQLPVIAQEEDAADSYATLAILESYDEPQPILVDSAAAWFAMQAEMEEAGDDPYYFDEHDLSVQRAYRIICYAHGYDPDTYADAAAEVELPEERLETCAADSGQLLDGWNRLLADHLRTEEGPGGLITTAFAPTKRYADLAARMEEHGLLEDIANWLDETYDWPDELTLEAAECGEANAYYSSDDSKVTMCYEFVDYLYELSESVLEE